MESVHITRGVCVCTCLSVCVCVCVCVCARINIISPHTQDGSGEAAPKPPKKAKRNKGKRSKSTQLTPHTVVPIPPRSHSMTNTTELGEDTVAIELNQICE